MSPERRRILVVEDEAEVRHMLRSALPHEVIEAADAESALDLLVAGAIDLLVTDIALPRMDGCALAARVRERWPRIPILAISGYVDGRDVEEFHFDAFLAKPVALQRLRDEVAALLARVET